MSRLRFSYLGSNWVGADARLRNSFFVLDTEEYHNPNFRQLKILTLTAQKRATTGQTTVKGRIEELASVEVDPPTAASAKLSHSQKLKSVFVMFLGATRVLAYSESTGTQTMIFPLPDSTFTAITVLQDRLLLSSASKVRYAQLSCDVGAACLHVQAPLAIFCGNEEGCQDGPLKDIQFSSINGLFLVRACSSWWASYAVLCACFHPRFLNFVKHCLILSSSHCIFWNLHEILHLCDMFTFFSTLSGCKVMHEC